MQSDYKNYLDSRNIDTEETIEPILWQVDSLYYERFKTLVLYFPIENKDDYIYTPINIPDNYFITEMLSGKFNRSELLEDSDIATPTDSSDTALIEDAILDFDYTLIGNTILVKNLESSMLVKLSIVYVEKVYSNLLPPLKDIFDIILYGIETGDNNTLYNGIVKLSSFKRDRKAERIPKRHRVSGTSLPAIRRSLR